MAKVMSIMDEHGNAQTIDGEHLIDVFGNFAKRRDSHEWLWKFNNNECSGGKWNIWMTPTRWPRHRWSRMACDYGDKLIWKHNYMATYLTNRGNRAKKDFDKMRYYYGVE